MRRSSCRINPKPLPKARAPKKRKAAKRAKTKRKAPARKVRRVRKNPGPARRFIVEAYYRGRHVHRISYLAPSEVMVLDENQAKIFFSERAANAAAVALRKSIARLDYGPGYEWVRARPA